MFSSEPRAHALRTPGVTGMFDSVAENGQDATPYTLAHEADLD